MVGLRLFGFFYGRVDSFNVFFNTLYGGLGFVFSLGKLYTMISFIGCTSIFSLWEEGAIFFALRRAGFSLFFRFFVTFIYLI